MVLRGVPVWNDRVTPVLMSEQPCGTVPGAGAHVTQGRLIGSALFPAPGTMVSFANRRGYATTDSPFVSMTCFTPYDDPQRYVPGAFSWKVSVPVSDLIQNADPNQTYNVRIRVRGMVETIRIVKNDPAVFAESVPRPVFCPVLYDPYRQIGGMHVAPCDSAPACGGGLLSEIAAVATHGYALTWHGDPLGSICEWAPEGWQGGDPSKRAWSFDKPHTDWFYHGHPGTDADVLNMLEFENERLRTAAYNIGGCKAVRMWVPVIPMKLKTSHAFSRYPDEFVAPTAPDRPGNSIYQLVVTDSSGTAKNVYALNTVPQSGPGSPHSENEWFAADQWVMTTWFTLRGDSMENRGALMEQYGLPHTMYPGLLEHFPVVPIDLMIETQVMGSDILVLWYDNNNGRAWPVHGYALAQTIHHLAAWRMSDTVAIVGQWLRGEASLPADWWIPGSDPAAMFEWHQQNVVQPLTALLQELYDSQAQQHGPVRWELTGAFPRVDSMCNEMAVLENRTVGTAEPALHDFARFNQYVVVDSVEVL